MIELVLSVDEAIWLREVMQNPIQHVGQFVGETFHDECIRKEFFEVLNQGIGDKVSPKFIIGEDNIPF